MSQLKIDLTTDIRLNGEKLSFSFKIKNKARMSTFETSN